jgi:hypothetical protein
MPGVHWRLTKSERPMSRILPNASRTATLLAARAFGWNVGIMVPPGHLAGVAPN